MVRAAREPELLEGAVYGLPELHREQIREAGLVANPGCYPTASLLALAPLAAEGLLSDVVIDAKQGVSGAGRGGEEETQYVSMDENAFAYKTEGHRHRPEIEQEPPGSGTRSRWPSSRTFCRSTRESWWSCYARYHRAGHGWAARSTSSAPGMRPALRPGGGAPSGAARRPQHQRVPCLRCTVEERGRVLVFAAIDNLWKGAASQAVQNLNLMLGLEEGAGLR